MSEFSLENILLAQELISARVQFDQYQNIVGIRPRSTVFIPNYSIANIRYHMADDISKHLFETASSYTAER